MIRLWWFGFWTDDASAEPPVVVTAFHVRDLRRPSRKRWL